MTEFWVSSGHHLTQRDEGGGLAVTDELILAWGTSQFQTHGIDPQLHVGTIAETQLRHMYEPLVKFERDLTTISPCLATAWERLDDLTVQFQLREGVTFHNGEPFNAEAVAYSVMRPLSDETPGDARSTYSIISGVDVIDDMTVNVTTSKPDPALARRRGLCKCGRGGLSRPHRSGQSELFRDRRPALCHFC